MPILVSFTVAGFGVGAPQDPISGSIAYDAATATSNINSLTSINLTIAGHVYTVGEIGFISTGFFQEIGGTVNTVSGLSAFADDFFLGWNEATLTPFDFIYGTSNSYLYDQSSVGFQQFSVTATPEPATLPVMLTGGAAMAMLGWLRRRRLTATGRLYCARV